MAEEDTQSLITKACIIVVSLVFSVCILYYAATDPNTLISMNYIYALSIIITILFGFIAISMSSGSISKIANSFINMDYKQFIGFIGVFIAFICLMAAYKYMNKTSLLLAGYIINIFVFLIIIVGLSIVYNIFMNYFSKLEGVSGLIAHLIFYIPCLISDFIEYLKEEYRITPNVVFILFCIEIVLVLGYLYLPMIIQRIFVKPGTQMIGEPVFLTKPTVAATSQFIPRFSRQNITYDTSGNAQTIDIGNVKFADGGEVSLSEDSVDYYKNYAISMWVYVNQQATSNSAYSASSVTVAANNKPNWSPGYPREKVLFSYGVSTGTVTKETREIVKLTYDNGAIVDTKYKTGYEHPTTNDFKPLITYFNDMDENGASQSGIFIYASTRGNDNNLSTEIKDDVLSDGTVIRYRILDFPLQKWNQLVINYNNNIADIFINGALVQSINYNKLENRPKYTFWDCINVGDTDGVDGAICNLVYFTEPLSLTEIVNSYNINQFQNPPLL